MNNGNFLKEIINYLESNYLIFYRIFLEKIPCFKFLFKNNDTSDFLRV